ncbi:hypothetical protein U2F26_25825 [Micromonospora sp. 4G57]|uniref:Peptidase M23 n=1 Tax=Micromonospora sicca TaxID=2202420 RepID=A0ABU5JH98_9ACTN|nr:MULTISPECIES: hypothetical protein [unclassified Micromonospora]MDZ5446109.1 hypothetical protein [Micromonospora sp. 4G57]MDZ5492007.1 hypothetical protein [Micromonospora sp. 4G53]
MHPDDSPEQKQTETPPTGRTTDVASAERTIGRHRAPEPPRRGPLASTSARIAVATGVTCCLGLVAVVGARDIGQRHEPVREVMADRAAAAAEAEQRASRDFERTAPPVAVPVTPVPAATPSPKPTKKAPRKPVRPKRPRPVAGLDQRQMDNAKVIVDVGRDMKLPRRGLIVAIATAMQESNLYNLASDVLPESYDYPHQGSGADHDSVGLFQQRPSSGWGSVAELMRPAYAARAFYAALLEVPGWADLSITEAAQTVQVSAFPDAYAKHEERATTVVDALI